MGTLTINNDMSRYKKLIANIESRYHSGDNKPFLKYIIRNIKYKAKTNNIPFNLTIGDIHIPDHCPILGIPLKIGFNSGSGGNPDSISIDRIDPNKGYVNGNVQIISHKANTLKNDATLEELKLILDYVKNNNI